MRTELPTVISLSTNDSLAKSVSLSNLLAGLDFFFDFMNPKTTSFTMHSGSITISGGSFWSRLTPYVAKVDSVSTWRFNADTCDVTFSGVI